MDDILLLDTTERYLNGELSTEEKEAFEKLRQQNPEVDQKNGRRAQHVSSPDRCLC